MGISIKCVSADYIGSVRNYVEKKSDYLFAFFQGAAGNLGSSSKIKHEKLTKPRPPPVEPVFLPPRS